MLGFFSYRGRIKGDMLKKIPISAIEKVKFTVCDQDGAHRSLFNSLSMTNESPEFVINGKRIHFFFHDSPHLKSLRNNFRKYNLKMEENVLSWDHIDKFFKVDQTQEIRLAPKLTHLHIFKHGYSDMRVNLAAQEFSRTVSAGLHCHSVSGFIPKEAVYTAKFIYEIDRLFDCFNSCSKFHYKEIKSAITPTSCHLKFMSYIENYIKSWSFCKPNDVHCHDNYS